MLHVIPLLSFPLSLHCLVHEKKSQNEELGRLNSFRQQDKWQRPGLYKTFPKNYHEESIVSWKNKHNRGFNHRSQQTTVF